MTMQIDLHEGRFERAILATIKAEIEIIAQEEAEAAKRRIDERIAQKLAGIVASVCSNYRFETSGEEIVIRVQQKDIVR